MENNHKFNKVINSLTQSHVLFWFSCLRRCRFTEHCEKNGASHGPRREKKNVGKSLFFLWVYKYDLVPLCVCACVHALKLWAMCPQWLLKNNPFYLMTLARAVWFGLQKSCNFLEMCGWSSGRTVINRDPTPEQSSQKIHGSITNYPVGQLSNRITHKAHHRQHWTNSEMYHGSDKERTDMNSYSCSCPHVFAHVHWCCFDRACEPSWLQVSIPDAWPCRRGTASSGSKSRIYMKDYETIVCIRLLNPFFFFVLYQHISATGSYRLHHFEAKALFLLFGSTKAQGCTEGSHLGNSEILCIILYPSPSVSHSIHSACCWDLSFDLFWHIQIISNSSLRPRRVV